MNIVVIGMGYVGTVTAAIFARQGHRVLGVDINDAKMDALRCGKSPVQEPGLPELIKRVHFSGCLRPATDLAEAVTGSDVIIICVGTPSTASGALDTTAIERTCEQLGPLLAQHGGYPVVVMRSTVLPDVVERLIVPTLETTSGGTVGTDFGLAINPEFLREGTAIRDFDEPQLTLLGCDEARTATVLESMYDFVDAPVIVTDRRTACLVKYACNAFHALKVSFANEIDAVSQDSGVEGRDVMELVCMDRKLNISEAYLKPGAPFGGSCLPKDLRAVVQYGQARGVRLPVINAALESNRVRSEACTQRILAYGRKRIGVLGLAFKAGTDDLRESPMVAIVETLRGKGREVAIYDRNISPPELVGANRAYIDEHLPHVASLLRPSMAEVLQGCDVIVVGTRDPEFRPIRQLLRPDQHLVDLVGVADDERQVGFPVGESRRSASMR